MSAGGKMATDEGAAARTHADAAAAAPAPAAGRHEFAESLPDLLGKLPERAQKLVVEFLFGEQAKDAQESQAGAEVLDLEKLALRAKIAELEAKAARSEEAAAALAGQLKMERDVNNQQRAKLSALESRFQAIMPTGPSLSILAFNALKLRIDDPNINWDPVLRVFAESDVVIMSEITESSGPERVETLIKKLRDEFGATFNEFFSRPSGATAKKASASVAAASAAAPESAAAPKLSKSKVNKMKVKELRTELEARGLSTDGRRPELLKRLLESGAVGEGNQEHHVILVKKSLKVVATKTTEKIRNISMDYAPFSVLLHVPHFKKDVQYVCLTSVHLPPSSGKRADDNRTQGTALFKKYGEAICRGEWEVLKEKGTYSRMQGIPFGLQDTNASTPPVAHIIAGDHNANRSKLIGYGASDKNGWHVVLGDAVKTSAGDMAYDNFVISRETTFDSFVVSPIVYEPLLACPRRGEQGPSDHKLAGLRLTETMDRKA